MVFEVLFALKELKLHEKLDKSSLFIDGNLIGVDKILKSAASTQVFVDLHQVKKICGFNAWQLDNEVAAVKQSFPKCKPL